jgi:hypothetical protein
MTGSSENDNEPSGSQKVANFLTIAELLSASQEGLFSMQV